MYSFCLLSLEYMCKCYLLYLDVIGKMYFFIDYANSLVRTMSSYYFSASVLMLPATVASTCATVSEPCVAACSGTSTSNEAAQGHSRWKPEVEASHVLG